MQLLTNKNNLDILKDMISNAKREINICSAWITSKTLRQVFTEKVKQDLKSNKLKLRVIVRLGEETDVKITDPDVFKFVEEHKGQIHYHRKLHTKMYVIDDNLAMLGSFNLTGGGFGNDERIGSNPETGVFYKTKAEVKPFLEHFNFLWEEESKPISKDLIGFVLSPSNQNEYIIAGIKELPANQFVQVKVNTNEYILGKITLSERYTNNFYEHPDKMNDFKQRKQFFENYRSSEGIESFARFHAVHVEPSDQYNFAKIKILSRIFKKGKGIKSDINLTPPLVGSEVKAAEEEILNGLFNENNFAPGVMLSNDVEVGFKSDDLYDKHLAILGSTGSGKSFFAKTLLTKYIYDDFCVKSERREKGGRVIVFDTHGEYSDALTGRAEGAKFKMHKGQYEIIDTSKEKKLRSRYIHNAEDLEEILDRKFDKKQKDFLNEQISKFQRNGKQGVFVDQLKKENRTGDKIDYETKFSMVNNIIDKSMPLYLKPFIEIASKEFEANYYKSPTLDGNGNPKSAPAAEKSIYAIERAEELFNKLDKKTQSKIKGQVKRKAFYDDIEGFFEKELQILPNDIIEEINVKISTEDITFDKVNIIDKMNKNKIYCVNLSDIHDEEVRWELAAKIMRKIFDDKKEFNNEIIDTLFLVEEAHNFAPQRGNSNNVAARMMKRIAAEGRKFNLGLFLITQRPAYVNKDVLAQCSTQVIFRLMNNNDIGAIEELIEGISEEELKLLPQFKRGQGIFTGVAIEEPVLIKTNERKFLNS